MDFSFILPTALFVVPGYVVLYVVNLFVTYRYPKDQSDKIVEYLLYSSLAHGATVTLLFLAFVIGNLFGVGIASTFELWWTHFDAIGIGVISVILSPVIGYLLGKYYFARGYPYSHFKDTRNIQYFSTVYESVFSDAKMGAWVTCHLSDSTIVQGKLHKYTLDHDVQEYLIALTDCTRYFPKERFARTLKSKEVVLNLKTLLFVEVK